MNNWLRTLKLSLLTKGLQTAKGIIPLKLCLEVCSDSSLFFFLTNKQNFKEKLTVSNTAFESPNAFHTLDVF